MDKFKLGIVGHGFVGKAVAYGFTHPKVDQFYCDPKHNTNIDELCDWDPIATFVCAPTPMREDGTVDATIVEDAVLKLLQHTKSFIIIKSTITPPVLERIMMTASMSAHSSISESEGRICYNPEFLTENNALEQFIRMKLQVFGGTTEACRYAEFLYNQFSMCKMEKVIRMPAVEASFVKYAINSYLAMKVTFFNQLYDTVQDYGAQYNMIINAVESDERIGSSHNRVPGYDGKRGFGGACLPKDSKAFTKITKHLTLLEEAITINNGYRSQYELDEREKSNNVNYG